MRMIRLLAFAMPLAVLLPMTAHADKWPDDVKKDYMKDCVAAASQSVSQEAAKQHCTCGANQIAKNLTTPEIRELMDKKKLPSVELRTRALDAIQSCKAQPKAAK